MCLAMALVQNWRVQRLVGEFDHHTACWAFQPLWGQSEVCTWIATRDARNNHGGLSPIVWPRVISRLQDMKMRITIRLRIEQG